jgi:isocitrate dehydrogenase kinase/phosphatase
MTPEIAALFDEAETCYLKPEALKLLSQYVASMPERLDTYCALRDRELEIMQTVADQLQADLPEESQENLERCIKHALLMLRNCALGLLLNDETLVQRRFLAWVCPLAKAYNTKAIDTHLYQLLNQVLSQALTTKQFNDLSPSLSFAQAALLSQLPSSNAEQYAELSRTEGIALALTPCFSTPYTPPPSS